MRVIAAGRGRQTMRSWGSVIGAVVAAAIVAPDTATAADMPPGTITVEGEAAADVVPDIAHLSLGIEIERPTAAAASAEVARVAQAIGEGLTSDGSGPDDRTTTALSLEPLYADQPQNGAPHLPRGFRAATRFTVTVTPAPRAGIIASHAVDHGATLIADIAYDASHKEATLDALRTKAVQDARHKAEIYVTALGLHLGQVLEILPIATAPMRWPVAVRAAMAPSASLPSAPGTLALQAAVTVRWAISP